MGTIQVKKSWITERKALTLPTVAGLRRKIAKDHKAYMLLLGSDDPRLQAIECRLAVNRDALTKAYHQRHDDEASHFANVAL